MWQQLFCLRKRRTVALECGSLCKFGMTSFSFKIFHSILKVSSIFYSILPYQGNRLEAAHNLFCIFATLSVPLQVVAHKGKQYGTMHPHPLFEALLQ